MVRPACRSDGLVSFHTTDGRCVAGCRLADRNLCRRSITHLVRELGRSFVGYCGHGAVGVDHDCSSRSHGPCPLRTRALQSHSLPEARSAVAQIVGRDTEEMAESDIVRAAVETIAESTADGIIAPLFYLVLGGAPLALAYKAINTLDSMIGHMDERYRWFGWASARLDDLVNFIPARITALLLVLSAGILFRSWSVMRRTWRILLRDGGSHPSPNSGRPEAAMAGALGVQLGGINRYDGLQIERPRLGDPDQPLTRAHIGLALRLMGWASFLGVLLGMGLLMVQE